MDLEPSGTQDVVRTNSAADELARELEAMRSQVGSTEPLAGPVVAQPSIRAVPGVIVGADPEAGSPEDALGGLLRRGELNRNIGDQPEAAASAPETEPSTPLPESYSGRVYLLFPAALTQNELESVWEGLEEVAGMGTISDHRLISRQDGVQFTLELGNKELAVDRLRKQMPGAGLTALAEDRLRVDWPRHD